MLDAFLRQPFWPLAAVHGLWLAALLGLAWRRPQDGEIARPLLALQTLVIFAAVLNHHVRLAWISPLREGTSMNHAEVVAAEAIQQGPGMTGFWMELLPVTFDLGGVVAANLAFAISSFFILQPILTRLSGSQEVATALLLATALSPTMEVTALSETGGWLTVWMTALAALPVATLLTPSTPADRALARGALVLQALAFAAVRTELMALPLAACGLGVTPPAWDDWVQRRLTRTMLAAGAAVVAALIVLHPVYLADPLQFGHASVLLTVVQPWNVLWAALPLEWARHLALPVVVAAMVGLGAALRRPFASAGLGLVVLMLGALYRAEAHQPWLLHPSGASGWELVRYAPHLLVPMLALAALGARHLPIPKPAWLVLALIPPLSRPLTLLGTVEPADDFGARAIDQDAQREVRALYQHLLDEPDCAVLLPVRGWGPIGSDRSLTWAALTYDAVGAHLHREKLAPMGPAEAAQALIPAENCVVVWRSLDCGTTPGADCSAIDALPHLSDDRWPTRPFVHPEHGVRWTDETWVGWRSLKAP